MYHLLSNKHKEILTENHEKQSTKNKQKKSMANATSSAVNKKIKNTGEFPKLLYVWKGLYPMDNSDGYTVLVW